MFGPDMNYEPLAYEPLAGADESSESSQHFSVREGELANEADNVHGWLGIPGIV